MAKIIFHVEDEKSDRIKVSKIFIEEMEGKNDEQLNFSSQLEGKSIKPYYSKNLDIVLIQTDNIKEANFFLKNKEFRKNLVYTILDMDLPLDSTDYNKTDELGGQEIKKTIDNYPELSNIPYSFCTLNEYNQIGSVEKIIGEFPRIVKEDEETYEKNIRIIFQSLQCTKEVIELRSKYKYLKPWFKNNNLISYFNDLTEIGGKIYLADNYSSELIMQLDKLHSKYEGLLRNFNSNATDTIFRNFPMRWEAITGENKHGKKLIKSMQVSKHNENLSFYSGEIIPLGNFKGQSEIIDFQWQNIIGSWLYISKCKHDKGNTELLDKMIERTDRYTGMLIFDNIMFTIFKLSELRSNLKRSK